MEDQDRLSELPESLIHHILSFLPITDVVKTTILSKSWEDVWTTIPCLNLIREDFSTTYEDGDDVEDWNIVESEKFRNIVNWALILWKGDKIKGDKILKFKIDVHSVLVSDVNVWIRFAVNNKVEELEVISTEGLNRAPHCLNSCSSLTKLSLVGLDVQNLKSPSWHHLKSLSISMRTPSRISGDLINQILLGSPELEVFELELELNHKNLNITSRSLKTLKIGNSYYYYKQPMDTVRICCPNLEKLQISGVFGKCLFTDISSLIDVTLDFEYFNGSASLYEFLGETMMQVLSTNPRVEKVALSDWYVQVMGASQKKYLIPSLPNVKFLRLDLHRIEFSNIVDVLRIFPNLKMLVIEHDLYEKSDFNIMKYMECETNLFNSFLLQLKIVEITLSDFSMFGIIEFLLKHAIMLEKFVLRYSWFEPCQQKVCSEKIMSMPRSSPTVEVILKEK